MIVSVDDGARGDYAALDWPTMDQLDSEATVSEDEVVLQSVAVSRHSSACRALDLPLVHFWDFDRDPLIVDLECCARRAGIACRFVGAVAVVEKLLTCGRNDASSAPQALRLDHLRLGRMLRNMGCIPAGEGIDD